MKPGPDVLLTSAKFTFTTRKAMQSLLITPKDDAELELLSALLTRLNITTTVIAEDDREDVGLGILLQQADRSEHVSRESIFKALGRA